jgi:hypothetical protein
MSAVPSVDDLVQLGFELVCDEAREIMGGEDHITMDDMTACEMVALLTILRQARERKRLAQRQPAAVLKLVRAGMSSRSSTIRPREPEGKGG